MLFSSTLLLFLCYPAEIFSFSSNREIVILQEPKCHYYDSIYYEVLPQTLLQNRFGEPQSGDLFFVDNRLKKDLPSYQNDLNKNEEKYQPKFKLERFEKSDEEEEATNDDVLQMNYEHLWKVGEFPESKTVQALPDIYVKPGDAPPIVDLLSMEQSELTVETHDLENVEIQEKFLNDPQSQIKEVIIERVTTRPEPNTTGNPALENFKEIEFTTVENEKIEHTTVSNIMKIDKKKSEKKEKKKGK